MKTNLTELERLLASRPVVKTRKVKTQKVNAPIDTHIVLQTQLNYILADIPKEYRDKIVAKDWTISTNKMFKRLMGRCEHSKKNISISCYIPRTQLDDTLRHELAHMVLGSGYGHGKVWQTMAVKLGAKPNACASVSLGVTKYVYVCECGNEYPNCKRQYAKGRMCGNCKRPIKKERYQIQDEGFQTLPKLSPTKIRNFGKSFSIAS